MTVDAFIRTICADVSLQETFWSRVDRSGDCWSWLGMRHERTWNYGVFATRGHRVFAHRVAYALTHGPFTGHVILHRCDNPCCVNPQHLSIGTHRDNVRDCVSKRRHAFGEGRSVNTKLTLDAVKIVMSSWGR